MSYLKTLSASCAFSALLGAVALPGAAPAQSDPTSGRIQQRESVNLAQYFECAEFALTVYRAAAGQAQGDPAKLRAALAHYHDNLARCHATFL